MKKLILAFVVFICFEINAQNKNEAKVNALMIAQEAKWNEGDIPGFMQFYWKSDSLKFIGSKGITYGWQKTLDNYLKRYPDKNAMGILKFTIIENTQLSKNTIFVIGKWALEKEKPVSGHFTAIWKKIDKKWVMVSDHTS
jgi:ketosteroid isomerase-like protein